MRNHGPFSLFGSDPMYPCEACINQRRGGGYHPGRSFTLVGPEDLIRPLVWQTASRPAHRRRLRPVADIDPHRPPGRWIVRCPAGHEQTISQQATSRWDRLVYRFWYHKDAVTEDGRRSATRGLVLYLGDDRIFGLFLWTMWDRGRTPHQFHFAIPY